MSETHGYLTMYATSEGKSGAMLPCLVYSPFDMNESQLVIRFDIGVVSLDSCWREFEWISSAV